MNTLLYYIVLSYIMFVYTSMSLSCSSLILFTFLRLEMGLPIGMQDQMRTYVKLYDIILP